jgi:hypothetical protein
MSVDLKSKSGVEFGRSWWDWRPIATYCFEIAPMLCENSNHVSRWQTNEGSMSAREAVVLADLLQEEIDSGRTKKYVQEFQRDLENMPDVECNICEGTGKVSPLAGLEDHRKSLKYLMNLDAEKTGVTAEIKHYAKMAYLEHALQDPTPIDCGACDGYGRRRPSACMYRMSLANVQELVDFLVKCDGFEVT